MLNTGDDPKARGWRLAGAGGRGSVSQTSLCSSKSTDPPQGVLRVEERMALDIQGPVMQKVFLKRAGRGLPIPEPRYVTDAPVLANACKYNNV